MEFFRNLTDFLPDWSVVALITACSTVVMLLIKRIILVRIKRWVDRTPYKIDSLFLRSINVPLTIIVLVANLMLLQYLWVAFEVSGEPLFNFELVAIQILLILALVVFMDRFAGGALNNYASGHEALRNSKGLLTGIVRGFILGIGLLVLLGTLGISITPIIASLGITSLAVALALQPTLENFFSGLQLVLDKPFRVDDFIELDSGEQGFVEKIGWRSTWIRMLPNNMVIMPNSAMSNSKIINYYYPEKELSVPVEVGVHYRSDLEEVERITLEVAREILRTHKWGVPEYETFVVYHTFDSSSINFTVMLRAREYFNRFWVKSAFIKALHKRYAQEGITIPFPIRAVNLEQEGAADILAVPRDDD